MPQSSEKAPASNKRPDFTYVSPNDLLFDSTNPRFGGGSKSLSQEEIQSLLEGNPHHALELVDSFVQNGFIAYEPLVVRQSDSKYVVIEGNRRLAAVRHILANPSKYPSKAVRDLEKIPILVFHQAADAPHRAEIRTYLEAVS